jgi:sugar-specific transcriptional regulator TrmB
MVRNEVWGTQQAADELNRLTRDLDAAREELAAAKIAKMDRDMEQLCEERDNAEESLSQAYYLVVGNSPEWSNTFGQSHALEDIDDAIRGLKETAKAALATVEKWREQLAIAQRAGDNLRGYAKLLCDAVPPTEEHRAKFDRLRRAADRWESLRRVEFVVADEDAPTAAEAAREGKGTT